MKTKSSYIANGKKITAHVNEKKQHFCIKLYINHTHLNLYY